MDTTTATEITPALLDELYQEAVEVFGESVNAIHKGAEDAQMAFEDIVAKTLVFAETHNLPLQPGIITAYAAEIGAMPDLPQEDAHTAVVEKAELATPLQVEVNLLKKDTNRALKYMLILFAGLFVAILVERFAKVIAIVGLVVVGVLLFWHYKSIESLKTAIKTKL